MFYNYLIKAFLSDQSLFSDVKAIVDCPLKCDPAEVIRACRDKVPPREIMALLHTPGADLTFPVLTIPESLRYGRNRFLERLTDAKSVARRRPRRTTIGYSSGSEEVLKNMGRRNSLYSSKPVDMAQLLDMASDTAEAIEREGNKRLQALQAEDSKEVVAYGEEDVVTKKADDPTRERMLKQYYARLQVLGTSLIQIWTRFYRQVSPTWAQDRNSLIPLPKPFIVPGGRFIEIYYWDSYWIIRGLLSSGLIDVARDAIENFLYMVERFGFIPNGSRKYYQDRSQPPFLSTMIRAYWNSTGDKEFIANAFPLLDKEYQFWMNERLGHAVNLQMPDPANPSKTTHCVLNRFYSLEVTPRPESYRIDEITGRLYLEYKGAAESLEEHYRAVRAGAESGWDFSSRWLRPAIEGLGESGIRPDHRIDQELHKLCLIDIDTCNVIPCDLNGILFAMENDLSFFAELLGHHVQAQAYQAAAAKRRAAMLHFNWDPEQERWMDYDMKTQRLSKVISAASFIPLWADVNPEPMDDKRRMQLASNLSPIIRPYGIVSTHVRAGLQWDSPNVWACSHHIAVDFMCGGRFWETTKKAEDDNGPAMQLGINWASRFVNTVLDRFEFRGTCSEKYHCYRPGKSGMDGEYVTQEGFGWTNGAVLDFLEKFGTRLSPQGLYAAPRPY
ncbi:trehalase [Gregarina niphandrodes]|uniref:Trehalase n=1 Tax=Gregarina niphandrodes TaxID=110365 RepID=A0A023B759_GRENI|nr:trehalase [Gregarina niphandrodes]EZG67006.1 trehalase [Gregarina niphandrodes]|eukprot:XP_011130393.1 trehalase [Gregarina niphandrodes]